MRLFATMLLLFSPFASAQAADEPGPPPDEAQLVKWLSALQSGNAAAKEEASRAIHKRSKESLRPLLRYGVKKLKAVLASDATPPQRAAQIGSFADPSQITVTFDVVKSILYELSFADFQKVAGDPERTFKISEESAFEIVILASDKEEALRQGIFAMVNSMGGELDPSAPLLISSQYEAAGSPAEKQAVNTCVQMIVRKATDFFIGNAMASEQAIAKRSARMTAAGEIVLRMLTADPNYLNAPKKEWERLVEVAEQKVAIAEGAAKEEATKSLEAAKRGLSAIQALIAAAAAKK